MSNYTVDDLKNAVSGSFCTSDVCKKLKVTVCTFNYTRIRKLCREHHVSTDHFDLKKTYRRNKFTWSVEDVFCEHSSIGRSQLRPLCVRLGMFTGRCSQCEGSDVWQAEPLTIELDHINGISDDNRVENLRWLCPNCHSQTNTYRNRGGKHTRPITS